MLFRSDGWFPCDHRGAAGPIRGDQSGRQIAVADVFGERACHLLRQVSGHRNGLQHAPEVRCQSGKPCDGPIMHMSMGMESRKFVREAYRATLRAAAFSASVAGTMPRIFF